MTPEEKPAPRKVPLPIARKIDSYRALSDGYFAIGLLCAMATGVSFLWEAAHVFIVAFLLGAICSGLFSEVFRRKWESLVDLYVGNGYVLEDPFSPADF